MRNTSIAAAQANQELGLLDRVRADAIVSAAEEVRSGKLRSALALIGPQSGAGGDQPSAPQAGSSILPGKVNPVIPEVVNQIAFEVFGNDATVTFAAEAG